MEALHNGGATDSYRWGQTLEEVTVILPLGLGVRARDLTVTIGRTACRASLKRNDSALLEGTLAQPICCEESTWMVEEGCLVLTLAKDNRRAENTGPRC